MCLSQGKQKNQHIDLFFASAPSRLFSLVSEMVTAFLVAFGIIVPDVFFTSVFFF